MSDPLLLLLAAGAVLALLVLLLWPERGLAWRWVRGLEARGRVEVEDALKHLWDGEYRRQPTTLTSVAGALGLSGREATELVTRLERLELVRHDGQSLGLTEAGRREALRVVRIHRLWERYLADRTGLDAARWHAEAERREHRTSAEQAEALAAALGDPRFDPHGDPIPMASGEVPPPRGVAVATLEVGDVAEIVHVEDEPEVVYTEILSRGVHPGAEIAMLRRDESRVAFELDGREVTLTPVVAANVSVRPLPRGSAGRAGAPRLTLAEVKPGQRAEIIRISEACRGIERRRLMDLGLVPGTAISLERRGMTGGASAYRVRGTLIALRREQASTIGVEILSEAS